jgi:hypothetical protein
MNDFYDFSGPSPLFTDSPAFTAYAEHIGALILALPDGRDGRLGSITIRGIHEALGCQARPAWTCDALDSLFASVESFGFKPTRYRRRSGPPLTRPAGRRSIILPGSNRT